MEPIRIRALSLLLAALAVACTGEASAPEQAEVAPTASAHTDPVPLTVFGGGCAQTYVSGGTAWYQDCFSAKWCTGSYVTPAGEVWDYTGCTWTGWYQGGSDYFCGTGVPGYAAGWEWVRTVHYHCP